MLKKILLFLILHPHINAAEANKNQIEILGKTETIKKIEKIDQDGAKGFMVYFEESHGERKNLFVVRLNGELCGNITTIYDLSKKTLLELNQKISELDQK